MVPDVLLAERFGDTAMTESFRKIEDDFARLIDATKNEAQRTKLDKQRQNAIRDLAAMRDRIRGVYGMDQFNTMRGAARVAQAVKELQRARQHGHGDGVEPARHGGRHVPAWARQRCSATHGRRSSAS
jgi:sugar phosphate isomerase/epimerase